MMNETKNEIPEALRLAARLMERAPKMQPRAGLDVSAARLLREQYAEIQRLREEVLELRGEIWELRSDLEAVNNR